MNITHIMTKKALATLAIAAAIVFPTVVAAQTPSTGDSDTSAGTPSVSSETSSVGVSTPSTDAGGSTSAGSNVGTTVPSTDSSGSTSAGPSAPSTDASGSTSAGPGSTNTSGGTTVVSGGGSSSSSSSGGSTSVTSSGGLPNLASIGQCSYITSYMKIGGNNSVAEVSKLQAFLKNTEGLNVDINGTYDQKTFDAVSAFQTKYVNDVMAPWGVTSPTGQVYITTANKINEIYCQSNFNLTPAQLAEITAYRTGVANGTITATGSTTDSINSTSSIPLTPDVGIAPTDSNSQTAAVANTGFFGKVWKAIKHVFGR